MADFASLRETALHVVRVVRVLEILQVTGNARRLGQVVVVVDVAIGAGARRHGVHPGEREPGFAVIEVRRRPGDGCVTGLASL